MDDWELIEPFSWLHEKHGAVQRIDGLWYGIKFNTDELLGGFTTIDEAKTMMEAESKWNE